MANESGTGQEAWDIVAKRMRAASTIAANCNTFTLGVYDRLVLEELRERNDAFVRWQRELIHKVTMGGAL